nr:hypothetical protein [Sphingobium sp.]
MKDLHSAILATLAFAPAVLTDDPVPIAIDLLGYDAAEILLAVGVGGINFSGTNKIEFKLTHSDDDVTYTAVELKDVLGVAGVANGGIIKALTSAHAAAAAYRFGYKGGKRFLKLLPDFSGTHGTGTALSAIVLKGHGHDNPQPNQA